MGLLVTHLQHILLLTNTAMPSGKEMTMRRVVAAGSAAVLLFGAGAAFAATDSASSALSKLGIKKTAPPSKGVIASFDRTSANVWTAQVKGQLDRAGIRATLDGVTYDNLALANAMYSHAQQQAHRAAMASVQAAPSPDGRPVVPDLMKLLPPPDISYARAAIAGVVLDRLLWDQAVANHREATLDDAKALAKQSLAVINSSAQNKAANAALFGTSPQQSTSSPQALEAARRAITIGRERIFILTNAGITTAGTNQDRSALPADPSSPDPKSKALADWVGSAVKGHQFSTAGLGGFGPSELPATIASMN